MCGRLNVSDDPGVRLLLAQLGISEQANKLIYNRFIRAGQQIAIIIEENGVRLIKPATWWLLLEPHNGQLKLSRYTSFNSRSDKLTQPNSAGYTAFKTQRCIIAAKGFGETTLKGEQKHYYDFIANGALAFAGIYRMWQHPSLIEPVYSCSIITSPAHAKLRHYHHKSTPLMLAEEELEPWLNVTVNPNRFSLKAKINQTLSVHELLTPSSLQGVKLAEITPDHIRLSA